MQTRKNKIEIKENQVKEMCVATAIWSDCFDDSIKHELNFKQ
jgi:hypothetical protein